MQHGYSREGYSLRWTIWGAGGKGRGRGRGAPLRKGLFSDTVRKVRKTSKRIVRAYIRELDLERCGVPPPN